MAQVDLVINVNSGERVAGLTDTTITDLPRFVQGDTLTFKVFLLKGASRLATPERIPVSGITLQMAIGTRTGNSTNYYTQQFAWTASTDLADPYWTANLPMNTAEIGTLLGSGSSAVAWLELKMVQGGLPTTVLSKQITIDAAVIKDGGLVVPPGLTPLSAEAALAMFLQRDISGAITLTNPTTGAKLSLYVGDDGAFHADPLS